MRSRLVVAAAAYRYLRTHRYEVLFYTLVLTICTYPLLRVLELPAWPNELLLGLTLVQATFVSAAGRDRRAILFVIGVSVILRLLGRVLVGQALFDIVTATWAVAALLAATAAIRFLFRPTEAPTEPLYAALSAYLLVGLFFGVLYSAISTRLPSAILVSGEPATAINFTPGTATYFSFVTLATLGYGDIVPLHELTRGLAVLEAVGGQLFLAVLVARLVGPRSPPPAARQ